MNKRVLILLCPLLVAGCALPLPVQIASWAIDGISYLATRKSVAEHGLSIVTKKDCEVLRGLRGGGLCVDDVVSDTAIAAFEENLADSASMMVATMNAGKAAGFDDPFSALVEEDDGSFSVAALLDIDVPKMVVALLQDPGNLPTDAAPRANAFVSAESSVATFADPIDIGDLQIFTTASGPGPGETESPSFDDPGEQASAFVVARADVAELDRIDPAMPTDDETMLLADFATAAGTTEEDEGGEKALARDPMEPIVFEDSPIVVTPSNQAAESKTDVARRTPVAAQSAEVAGATAWVPTKDGLYYVLGSFGYLDNARRAARVFSALGPSVVSAKVKDRKMYRVVVGPFDDADKDFGKRLLIDAGISDSWSISLDSTTWTLVKRTRGVADEVASRPTRYDFAK